MGDPFELLRASSYDIYCGLSPSARSARSDRSAGGGVVTRGGCVWRGADPLDRGCAAAYVDGRPVLPGERACGSPPPPLSSFPSRHTRPRRLGERRAGRSGEEGRGGLSGGAGAGTSSRATCGSPPSGTASATTTRSASSPPPPPTTTTLLLRASPASVPPPPSTGMRA
eukprot:2986005-Rhodomonas_salina.1